MKIIIYQTETGIVKIVSPSVSAIRNKIPMEQIIADSHIPEGSEYKIVDETIVPKDYSEFKGFEGFQSALNYDMTLDVGRAKEIKKTKLRADRKPILEKLDIDFMRAMEVNDDALMLDITKAKQVLRDVTLLVDSCKTILAIKKVSV